MIRKLLIANRGEIACRIITTARKLGVATVAVYSDVDASSQHVQMADEAIHIGPANAAESYLLIDNIVDAARRSNASAIHPGYGFLSENADFADACEAAGIVFVGPTAETIRSMGSKSAAKALMQAHGVPLLPGYHGDDQQLETLREAAGDIGYPVLLKAAAGGGGKGMRVVNAAEDFERELAAAQRESMNAFGDDIMLVEKFLREPRHIEVQVFADHHGNIIHLFDRDCSIQRRHQKVIEEAPAPGLSDSLRAAMADAAVTAAKAIDYRGAGTVEFLLDADDGFYFMEMNTRLQVEHPVTELITGIDLVELQLQAADGQKLMLAQADVTRRGHAIEVRLYAEDTVNGFLPTSGRIDAMQIDDSQTAVRLDSGVVTGDEISVFYDPMIAKLAVVANTRADAVGAMAGALSRSVISGLTTNLAFLYRAITTPAFSAGAVSTGFIDSEAAALQRPTVSDAQVIAAALLTERAASIATSLWHRNDGWRSNLPWARRIPVTVEGVDFEVTITQSGPTDRSQLARVDDREYALAYETTDTSLKLTLNGHRQSVTWCQHAGAGMLFCGGHVSFSTTAVDVGETAEQQSDGMIRAPMTGKVIAIGVSEGDTVADQQPLLTLEAMKMEHTLNAPYAGHIDRCSCEVGQLVQGGAVLIALSPDESNNGN
ncbi:MAG: acetyl-CoA carboxylase biotin carboxylase subunit [Pseudomonadota bacterium]